MCGLFLEILRSIVKCISLYSFRTFYCHHIFLMHNSALWENCWLSFDFQSCDILYASERHFWSFISSYFCHVWLTIYDEPNMYAIDTANSQLAAFRLTANPAYCQLLPMYSWFSLHNLCKNPAIQPPPTANCL